MLLNIHELHKWEKTSLGLMTFRERREEGGGRTRAGGTRWHRHAVVVRVGKGDAGLLCGAAMSLVPRGRWLGRDEGWWDPVHPSGHGALGAAHPCQEPPAPVQAGFAFSLLQWGVELGRLRKGSCRFKGRCHCCPPKPCSQPGGG